MDDRMTISIRLKPHLQEYVRCKLNEEQPYVTKRNLIGVLIRPFLEVSPAGEQPAPGPDVMILQLPMYDDLNVRNGTVGITADNNAAFERILDAHFKDVFYTYIDDKVRYLRQEHTAKGAIKRSILQFCSDFGINFDNMTYDMLKKAYYRRSQRGVRKPPFFSSKVSLNCPLFFLI